MENSIRKALGYTDDQVITILIALKDDIRWMKKNRPQLMEEIIAYLGITDEELATARHKRIITKHMAEEHASLVVSGRIRPIAVLIDSAKRSGPSEQEQREAMETIKERVSAYISKH